MSTKRVYVKEARVARGMQAKILTNLARSSNSSQRIPRLAYRDFPPSSAILLDRPLNLDRGHRPLRGG